MKSGDLSACCNKKNAYRYGTFKRSSDSQNIQRFQCKTCKKTFSLATFDPQYYQKKRHLNYTVMMMLSSGVSMRRIRILLNINLKTVARKLQYLGEESRKKCRSYQDDTVTELQFDELQTIEHTKLKPVSVAMAVSKGTRKILGFQVSSMPATGHLAEKSRKKYGRRADNRIKGMRALFRNLSSYLGPDIYFSSDECTYYAPVVKRYFPQARYRQFKGEKSANTGQGELKKTRHDPLFTINHTFAMLRANINRLIRKTWCTTKKISALADHLAIYAWVHNHKLTPA